MERNRLKDINGHAKRHGERDRKSQLDTKRDRYKACQH